MSQRGIGMTSARTRDRLIARLQDQGVAHEGVLARMRALPRHLFVDEALASRAYEDVSLPIGHGQTISQPFVVARMTEAVLDGRDHIHKVLEIGTGCGYQTAVLAGFCGTVYSVERLAPLLSRTRQRLREVGVSNVHFRHGDGWNGWPTFAPYDGIVVTAAPEHVPAVLEQQLNDGGRLIIPVGPDGRQRLMRIERHGETFERTVLFDVAFVPLREGSA